MDELIWLSVFAAGIVSLFAVILLYGMITDLRRGKTGILMVILGCCIVGGLCYHDALAIVSSILFAAAWIAGLLEKKSRLLESPTGSTDVSSTQK